MAAFRYLSLLAVLFAGLTAKAECGPHDLQQIMKGFFPSEATTRKQLAKQKNIETRLHETEAADLDMIIDEGKPAYAALNREMSAKYPNLKRILDDPIAYKKEIDGLFAAQKKIDPLHPYRFDFSEFGSPMLEFMENSLGAKIITFNKEIARLQKSLVGKMGLRKKKIEDLRLGIKYMDEMLAEVKGYTQKDGSRKINYERFLELSYFYSRAIGMKDVTKFPLHTRALLKIDEAIDGYKEYSVAKEYRLYKENKFELFAEKSISGGYRTSEEEFAKAFYNKDKLEMVVVPTNTYFERDIFQRMMPYDIHFLGLTDEPILSEGFLRPGGKFFVHDIRHESARLFEKKRYEAVMALTPKQKEAMISKMDIWQKEMMEKVNAIEDENMKHAIIFYVFNHHHDRGMGLLPSVYLPEKGDAVPILLYTVMKAGGQKVDFKNGYHYLPKAYQWLREFWLPKIGEEISILKAGDASLMKDYQAIDQVLKNPKIDLKRTSSDVLGAATLIYTNEQLNQRMRKQQKYKKADQDVNP